MRFTVKIILFTVSKFIQIFLENPFYFFYNSQKFERFEKSYCFSCIIQQTCYLQLFSINSRFFFRKTHLFSKTAQFIWLFWEIYQIELQSTELHSTANLPPSMNFEKLKLFSGQPFFGKNPTFERFEKFLYFICIRHHFFYLQLVSKKSSFVFKKKHLFFCIPQILIFLRNHTVSVAFYIKFATISIFSTFQGFFRKTHLFLQKPKFWMFLETLVT